MTDAELTCLAVAQVLLRYDDEDGTERMRVHASGRGGRRRVAACADAIDAVLAKLSFGTAVELVKIAGVLAGLVGWSY